MAFTDEDITAMGAVDDAPATVAPRRARPGAAAGKTKAQNVPIANYESVVAPANSRLNQIANALGVAGIDDAGIRLDHDLSTRHLTEGLDPDVAAAVPKQFAYDTRRAEAAKGEKSLIPGGEEHASGEVFPEFGARWGGFVPADDKRRKEAEDAYRLAQLFLDKKDEKSAIPGYPGQFLFSREAPPEKKAAVRQLIAQKLLDEARTLPTQGQGAEVAARFKKLAQYIDSQDPALLAPESQTAHEVASLTKHASAPVARAVKTGIADALLTGFGNNVAPITMGLGSMIAKAPGLAAPGGGDTLDPADLAAAENPDVPRGTPVGLPGTRAASGTVGQNVEMMHQAIVEGLTGKAPDEQAAYIEQLKREHPVAYHAAAAAGWLADPVGLLGGKAFQAAKEGAAALGAGRLAAPAAAAAAVGAPTGVVAGRAAGSEADLRNAALGAVGEGAGQAAGAALGRVGSVAAGAPARLSQEEINQAARAIAHDLGQAETRHGIKGAGTPWEQVYQRLVKAHPDLAASLIQKADPVTGRARPNLVPELAHAADVVTAGHAAPTASSAAMHPMVTLSNPAATPAQLARDFAHEAMLHGPVRPALMVATGQAGHLKNAIDAPVAKLVTAIRGGNLEAFAAAVRAAHADGLSPAMIDAATEAFHRRNRGRR